jgi:GNAT superfamily N-acetyltransferase
MHIEIRPFTPALADDYFDFFDHRAFTDHEEWSCCYCTWFHMNKEDEKRIEEEISADGGKDAVHRILKNYAARLVSDTTLRGYLAYADGVPIGWCNANDKVAFHRFDLDAEINDCIRGTGSGATMAVVCFTVAPGFRGRGVATALLGRVCEDAKKDGYAAVEGYARLCDRYEPFDFTGPLRLYEKAGFAQAARKDNVVIMRKELG